MYYGVVSLGSIHHALEVLKDDRSLRGRQIDQLQSLVKSLQEEVNNLKAAEQARHQRVMLGQVAYRLDDLARDFVFRGKLQIAPLSIGEICKRDERKELSPEQCARWESFMRFLAVKQWMVSDVVAVAKSLRAGCFVDAYGPEEELEKVTQSQLEEWASLHLERTHVDGVKTFIRLVAEFAVGGLVLRNTKNAVPVVQACLKEPV